MSNRAALLIGKITHARKEWEAISSLVQLKVHNSLALLEFHGKHLTPAQEYGTGSRQDFMSKLKGGEYNDVVAIYRSNDSTKVTGPFDKELVSSLPASLKYITHNGAGYDNIDIPACSERNIGVSSTPIAPNDSTADSM
jgi:glyoxylate reductase